MAGGILNLVAQRQEDVYFTSKPVKTFFKGSPTIYKQYTNFGLQKFRLDFEGSTQLNMTAPSTFHFYVRRYADLLMDTYLYVTLPAIWSPIYPPTGATEGATSGPTMWAPYEFRWIKNLGAKIIKKISFYSGNFLLNEYSGNFMLAQVQRDFQKDKKELFDKMIGNVAELNDPANFGARVNMYPNAGFVDPAENPAGSEPSIRSTTLQIPIGAWFTMDSAMAYPLCSSQYSRLEIRIEFRPVCEWFQIRDVLDETNMFPYVAPNFNQFYMRMYRFLQPPPDTALGVNSYTDTREQWASDIHLRSTYAFLGDDERRKFIMEPQTYLIRQVHEQKFYNVTGSNKIELDSNGLVTNYLFYFQRSDANLRNEWSNYTNWPYDYLPYDLTVAPTSGNFTVIRVDPNTGDSVPVNIGAGVNPDGTPTGLMTSGVFSVANQKDILTTLGILLNGSYREDPLPASVFNRLEKYTRTTGNAPDGLYCYNFCLNSNSNVVQPSGYINMSKFSDNKIEFEMTTIYPPVNARAQTLTICDPATGEIVGINKPTWQIYEYNFDLYVFEERLNFVEFVSGNCGLKWAT